MLSPNLMARPRKSGARTKSGRPSRAYRGAARDAGTPQLQRKKLAAVNGAADPALSATPASILFAHGVINRDQLAAAEQYRRFYALSFGIPWRGVCLLGERGAGGSVPDVILERARHRLDTMVAALGADQKQEIDNLVISAWLPGWFCAAQGIGRPLAGDDRERDALLTGLEVLARV